MNDRSYPWRFILAVALFGVAESGGVVLLLERSVSGDEPIAAEGMGVEELPEPVRSIIGNGRKLRQGEFRAAGVYHKTTRLVKGESVREERERYDFCLEEEFDFDANCLFFRLERSRRGGKPHLQGSHDECLWYLSTPETNATLSLKGGERVAIVHGLFPLNTIRESKIQPPIFDPRLLGWSGLGTAFKFEEFLEKWFLKQKLTVTDDVVGIKRVHSRVELNKELSADVEWWCSEQQGWQPIRQRVTWNDERAISNLPDTNHMEIEWKEHEGVWVVNFVAVEEDQGSLRMTVHWDNVNHAIPTERFDWRNWQEGRDYDRLQVQEKGDFKRRFAPAN